MANLLYKNYTITAGANLDEDAGKWEPLARVDWVKKDGGRGFEVLSTIEERCDTEQAAIEQALETAKAWVDHRLAEQG
jgi:hypothetical protein